MGPLAVVQTPRPRSGFIHLARYPERLREGAKGLKWAPHTPPRRGSAQVGARAYWAGVWGVDRRCSLPVHGAASAAQAVTGSAQPPGYPHD